MLALYCVPARKPAVAALNPAHTTPAHFLPCLGPEPTLCRPQTPGGGEVTPRKQPPSASKQPLERPAPNWAASPFHAGLAKSPLLSPRPPGRPIQTQPMSLLKQLEQTRRPPAAPQPWPAAAPAQLQPVAGRVAAAHCSTAAGQVPAAQSVREPGSSAPQPQAQPEAAGAQAAAGTQLKPCAPASAAKPQPLVCYSITQVLQLAWVPTRHCRCCLPACAGTGPPPPTCCCQVASRVR